MVIKSLMFYMLCKVTIINLYVEQLSDLMNVSHGSRRQTIKARIVMVILLDDLQVISGHLSIISGISNDLQVFSDGFR